MTKNTTNKIIVPVVLIMGIFIGAVVVLRTQDIGAALITEGKKVLFPIASEPDADPDNDGLKNWEEELYKTDPRNPDTDGDGYLDGEEVASGYDPTVPAPNDALEGTNTGKPRPLPQNLTTQLAQMMADKIASGEVEPSQLGEIALDDPAGIYNQDILGEAMYQIGLRANQYFVLPEIKDSDIKISGQQTNYEEIGRYITAMGRAVEPTEALKNLKGIEAEFIREAIETGSMRKIEILLESYKLNIEKTKQVTAPKDFSDIHKKQIAIYMLIVKIMGAIKNFQEDPAMAAAAVETYPTVTDMLRNFSEELFAKIEQYQ